MAKIIIEGAYGRGKIGVHFSLMSKNGKRLMTSAVYSSTLYCKRAIKAVALAISEGVVIEDYTHKDYPKITELHIAPNDKRSVATDAS